MNKNVNWGLMNHQSNEPPQDVIEKAYELYPYVGGNQRLPETIEINRKRHEYINAEMQKVQIMQDGDNG